MFSRREFLQRTLQGSSLLALGAAGHLTVPGFLAKSALAAEPGSESILVVVELTGGNDGLNTIIPYGDDAYHKARPTIGIAKDALYAIDDYVGMPYAMADLSVLLEAEQLAGLVELADVVLAGTRRFVVGIRGLAAQAIDEHVGGRLKADDQIGRRDVSRQQVVEPLIDEQLVVVQIQVREDLVLVEDVVAHCRLQEQVGLAQARQLAVTAHQIEQLRLERGTGPVVVEIGQERVLGVFEDGAGVEVCREAPGQRGLADPDGTFDGEMVEGQASRV